MSAGRVVSWSIAAVALLAVAGCGRNEAAASPPAVVVALPVRPDAGTAGGAAIRYPVEVAARYSNPMSFRIPGKLIERKVRSGDTVKKGEAVAWLDPIDAEKQAASAQAALEAAEHRLLFARQQLERDTAQAERNLIATNQLEQTQDAFTAARAGREEAAAQLVVARNNLQYNTLVADHDGVITSENADTGQVVAAGQAVYGLAWSGDTDATLDAAASDLGRIAIGQSATVTFPALPGQRFEARVRELAPAADPQSRTYRVKLTLLNPGKMVKLGMTGEAILAPAAAGQAGSGGASAAAGTGAAGVGAATFTVPATAIFHQGSSPAVWVVNDSSTLELRPVIVSRYTDHTIVISRGLKDGEMVVLAGVHTVFAGERVTPVRPLFDESGDVEAPAAAPAGIGNGATGAAR
ncbi:MAG TPA: efflux RND transporter periplasmic adaptor subunit [Steroidobacteraceae bacterium]|nr:efflux RND transporter periplasmic adaptor subunit [Steroidobacteraceae bacterium]